MTSAYAYGHSHRKERVRLLAALRDGEPCPLCGGPMFRAQRLHLDHVEPVALGGNGPRRLTHAACNEARGGRLAGQLRRARGGQGQSTGRRRAPAATQQPRTSRQW